MKFPDLKGKWVVVTGAGGGIGRSTALAFARRGANVVLSDISAQALSAVEAEVRALGVSTHVATVDVSNEAAMREFADAVHQKVGAVDVVVNNAGIGYIGPMFDSPLESWKRVLDINVMGVVHGCCFFGPRMKAAAGPRRIVNVASLAGIAPAPNMSAYAATKHAVMGLSDVLAMELDGTNVGVTTVCPGIINTAITSHRGNIAASITDAQLAQLQAYYKANGVSPDVVAEAIVD
ncbi:MAG: SDR family NAD(P)-dependent oxidoreductase, partial [Burkholderiaceae bacterium]